MEHEYRVLCVDDEPDVLDLTGVYLERDGRFAVETATSVDTALDLLDGGAAIDAIVSDYQMPGQDGLDLLEAVRTTDGEIPFILFTGRGSEEIASQAITAGVTDYLQKRGPEQYELLANRLGNAIEQHTIRERLERERELRSRILETSPVGIVGHDRDGTVRFRNRRAETILDVPIAGLHGAAYPSSGWTLYDTSGEEVPPERLPYRRVVERGEPLVDVSYQVVRPDGETRQLRLSGAPLRTGTTVDGAVIAFSVDDRDRRFEELADLSPDGVFRVDTGGRFTYLSETAEHLFGTDETAILGTHFTDYLEGEDTTRAMEGFARVTGGETVRDLELTVHRPDGDSLAAAVNATPFYEGGELVGVLGFGRDISLRKEREAALRRTQARYEALVDAFPNGGVFLFDTDLRFTIVGGDELEQSGLTAEMMEGKTPREVFPPENAVLLEEAYHAALDGERTVFEDSYQGRHYRVEVVPLRDDDGGVEGGMAVAQNITERKEQEATLHRNRARYEALVELFPNGAVFFFDTDLRFTLVGGSALEAQGFAPEHLVGKTPHDVLPAEDATHLADAYRETLSGAELSFEVTWGERHYEIGTLPLRGDGAVVGGLAVAQDVTEHREREAELQRQRDRLDAFTSVVSHDLRNPLNVAEGHLALLAEEVENDHIDPIDRALTRMETLITNLLTVARDGDEALTPVQVELAACVESAWANVETPNATLVVETDQFVVADDSRLRQLLENLLRNSVEHGSTSSRPRADDSVEHAGSDVTVTVGPLADGVGFAVADDGPGIPEDEREEVVTVGYSTATDGIGLGLAIVDDIADAHGWSLDITESETGGARFEFTDVEQVG